MFTFHDKSVQLESGPERSRKFSILHAEKHRNQWQDNSAGLRLTQISVLVEFGDLVCLISDLTNIISRYSNKSSYFEQKLDSRVYRQAMKWWCGRSLDPPSHLWKESKLENCFGFSFSSKKIRWMIQLMAPEAMTSESLEILNGDIDNWPRLVTTALIIHPPHDNSPSPPALVLDSQTMFNKREWERRSITLWFLRWHKT